MFVGRGFFETATEKFDRLIFDGSLVVREHGVAHWCWMGKHWIEHPLPTEVTDEWWDATADRLLSDHERCSEVSHQER